MFDIVCTYLIDIIKILIPCVFLRMVLDSFRNMIFKS